MKMFRHSFKYSLPMTAGLFYYSYNLKNHVSHSLARCNNNTVLKDKVVLITGATSGIGIIYSLIYKLQ